VSLIFSKHIFTENKGITGGNVFKRFLLTGYLKKKSINKRELKKGLEPISE
jgi:hypothetical protein